MLITLNELFFKHDTITIKSLNSINMFYTILVDQAVGIDFSWKKMCLQRKLELNSGPLGNLSHAGSHGQTRLMVKEIPTLLHRAFLVLIIPKLLINHALAWASFLGIEVLLPVPSSTWREDQLKHGREEMHPFIFFSSSLAGFSQTGYCVAL